MCGSPGPRCATPNADPARLVDSIAGQMSALRGTDAGSGEKQTKKKRITDVESSGSDTEGEEDSEGDSDTDTSTDEE